MPTPIPIRPETAVVQSGTSTTLASSSDQAAGGDAEADQGDRQRQAGGDHRAEGDQQHDRGAEEAEPLGARAFLGAVDRIAAELDLEPVAAVLFGGGDQLLAVLLRHLPAGDGQRQRRRRDRAVVGDADRRLPARRGRPASASARKASIALLRRRARRRRRGPSRRRRSPGPSSRRTRVRSGRSPPSTPSRACCSRRCTRPASEEPRPMITTVATIQARTMRPRRR